MPRRNLHYHPSLEHTPVAFNQHLSYEGARECPSWLSDHGLMNEEERDLLPTGDESLPHKPIATPKLTYPVPEGRGNHWTVGGFRGVLNDF